MQLLDLSDMLNQLLMLWSPLTSPFLTRTWSPPLFMVSVLSTSCSAPPSLKILISLISLNSGHKFSLLMPNNLVLMIPLRLPLSSITTKLPLPAVITALIPVAISQTAVAPAMAASDAVVLPSSTPLNNPRLHLLFL